MRMAGRRSGCTRRAPLIRRFRLGEGLGWWLPWPPREERSVAFGIDDRLSRACWTGARPDGAIGGTAVGAAAAPRAGRGAARGLARPYARRRQSTARARRFGGPGAAGGGAQRDPRPARVDAPPRHREDRRDRRAAGRLERMA